MRYHLESYLPVEAFKPRGGVFGSGGMTLHGGGGGIISSVTDTISNALGTAGGQSGILGGLADFDDAVSTSVKGGWGGLAETAAIIAASSVPVFGPFLAAGARGVFDYTHGGEDRKNALRNAGEQLVVSGAGSYGGALGAGAAKAGLEYTHGGADRENALQSGVIAGASQAASSAGKDYFFGPTAEAPVTDNSDYSYSPDSTPKTPAPNVNLNGNQTVGSYYNDGYTPAPDNPDISPDYLKVPGEPGFNMQPADSLLLGELPTSYIPTDMPPGTQFEGPNGREIVAPNGKTYLMKDLESALLNPPTVTAPSNVEPDVLTNVADTSPKLVVNNDDPFDKYVQEFGNTEAQPAGTRAAQLGTNTPAPVYDFSTPASPETQRMADMGMMDRLAQMPGYTYDVAKGYVTENPYTSAALAYGAYNALGSKPQQQPQPQGSPDASSGPYTGGYGSAGITSNPYLLRNRVNAQNVYGYSSPISRYAGGGEVQHFGVGGLSNAITRFTQPIEKAIVQPIGNAVPFLREAAPYAGLLAAPFIASPAMAAGVGALASGFGKPGSGFNMKRAMMGGIAAYGMSNIGAGIEAAGTTPAFGEAGTGLTTGSMDAALNTPEAASSGFFRNPDAMSAGIKNLAGGSTYNQAATQFATRAGLPSAGMAVMGTSGVMGIDEGIEQQKAADAAAAVAKGENQEFLNRIAAGKKRAQDAVKANPYMYAMGGSVDDEYGMDEARGLMTGNLQNGFMGGMPSYAKGGETKERRDYLNMMDAELRMPPAQYVEGMGFVTPPPSVGGRVGANFDALGGNIRAGVSGNAMMGQDRRIMARPEMMDIGYKGQVGPGELDVGLQRAIQSMPGRAKDYALNAKYSMNFAAGGTPRFLSGGGDGMSDSIPATIEGNQEARLADGEFVIPADVVSHLGNGSSKAGAKQLYSMMDRVRQARVGTKKQGREIKPKKFMPV